QPQDRATSLLEERGAHLREALGHIGRVEARNRPGTRPSLDFPQECRAEDGEQPGPGCGELMKLVQRAERAQTRLLDQVLRVRGLPCEVKRRAIQVAEIHEHVMLELLEPVAVGLHVESRPSFDCPTAWSSARTVADHAETW